MTDERYDDPLALRQALKDRLRRLADEGGGQLTDLQRQFAYDRLLARVFEAEPERWVLKGATAMLARLQGAARHTVDVDLYSRTGGLADAEQSLRAIAQTDLGDHFRFELQAARAMTQGARALRIPVVAYLGATEFAHFHVDLVTDLVMTGVPEEVLPLVPIELPGIVRTSYRAYPLADHIADKVCGLLETHPRVGATAIASTRYRDLVDLATFAHTASIDAAALETALVSEALRRELELPRRLKTPIGTDWQAGYARVARDAPGLEERDLRSAMTLVGAFIDPILSGAATGFWDTAMIRWGGGS